jgi:hypothetical protein
MLTAAAFIFCFSAGFGSGAWWTRIKTREKTRKYWSEVHDEESWAYMQKQRP